MDKTALNAHLVTTRLKRGFYHFKSAIDQMCRKVLVWLPMKGMISLISLLVRHVFRGDEFSVVFFRQARDWHRKSAGGALPYFYNRVHSGLKFFVCFLPAFAKFKPAALELEKCYPLSPRTLLTRTRPADHPSPCPSRFY